MFHENQVRGNSTYGTKSATYIWIRKRHISKLAIRKTILTRTCHKHLSIAIFLLIASKLHLLRWGPFCYLRHLSHTLEHNSDKRRAKFKSSHIAAAHKSQTHTLSYIVCHPPLIKQSLATQVSTSQPPTATTHYYKGGVRNGKTLFGFSNSVTPKRLCDFRERRT